MSWHDAGIKLCWRGDEEPSDIRLVSLCMGSLNDNSPDRTPGADPTATLERRFRITPALLHSIDHEGRLIEVSDAWLAKFGYRREEILGKKSSDFLTSESRNYATGKILPEFFRTGRCENVEYQMVCKDGRVLDVLLSAVLNPGDAENESCSLTVITDITEMRSAERKLVDREALYKELIESQTELVSLATPDGELRFVNKAYAQHYDRQPHELIGTNLLEYVPENVRGSVREQLRQVCESKQSIESENQVVMPNGQTRWMSWTNRAIFDAHGAVTGIHSVGRDIEQRVAADLRLKESEARYRLLAENSSDMVILVRNDGRRIYASPACHKILGWSPEEMLEMTTKDAVHPDDVRTIYDRLTELRTESVTLTYRMRRKDGGFIWVETTSKPISVAGHPSPRLLVVRDIEQRIQAERRLKESEAGYRLLADNSSDMVFQLDADFVVRYASPASRDLLGYEPAELIGVKPVEMTYPEDGILIQAAFRALATGQAERQTTVARRQRGDGRWIWVESQLKAVRNPETGAFLGIVGALRDISLRKAMEDELAEANRRLTILATRDGLTGLANRRAFDEALVREHRRATRESESLALIMVDVDRFKFFNDRYGHPAGDECLKQVAHAIAETIRRPGDMAARYGGEEFAVLLPNTDEKGAAETAERIRLAVSRLALEHDGARGCIVTISAGVSATNDLPGKATPDELLQNADRALYKAKHGGRDQVVNASWLAENQTREIEAIFATTRTFTDQRR